MAGIEIINKRFPVVKFYGLVLKMFEMEDFIVGSIMAAFECKLKAFGGY